ncbi:hypothetical protein GCM10009721_41530 [Terrabacter tumescens]|uniref:Acyltransferase 3 domain-containing protein n=1 Tax=Terrabacter tumescens TaxID=60443 RepID=A0ABQ2IIF9_9MICO|nr:acyltransferase [Terrabacter tumescens]GGN09340.1 hypothetical protein GCM10009721_41530 [Terrabacter tumescens]
MDERGGTGGAARSRGEAVPHWPGLDGLRGIAVLSVVLFHTATGWGANGFVGVDVFFALSGFLITSLLLREHRLTGGITLSAFYLRRALRLVPALVTVVLAVVGLSVVTGRVGAVVPGAAASLLYLSNWWIYSGHPAPLLEHTWTLSIEEHFYLVWPVLVAAWLSRRRSRRMASVVAAALALGILLTPWPGDLDGVRASYLRAAPIVLGCVLAVALDNDRVRAAVARPIRVAGPVALVVLTVLAFAPLKLDSAWLSGVKSVPGLLSALVVCALVCAPRSLASTCLSWKPLRWTGRRAYGIYLIHFPVISLMMHQVDLGLPVGMKGLVGAALSIALAAVSYTYIERPFLRRKARLAPKVDNSPAGAAIADVLAPLEGSRGWEPPR